MEYKLRVINRRKRRKLAGREDGEYRRVRIRGRKRWVRKSAGAAAPVTAG